MGQAAGRLMGAVAPVQFGAKENDVRLPFVIQQSTLSKETLEYLLEAEIFKGKKEKDRKMETERRLMMTMLLMMMMIKNDDDDDGDNDAIDSSQDTTTHNNTQQHTHTHHTQHTQQHNTQHIKSQTF